MAQSLKQSINYTYPCNWMDNKFTFKPHIDAIRLRIRLLAETCLVFSIWLSVKRLWKPYFSQYWIMATWFRDMRQPQLLQCWILNMSALWFINAASMTPLTGFYLIKKWVGLLFPLEQTSIYLYLFIKGFFPNCTLFWLHLCSRRVEIHNIRSQDELVSGKFYCESKTLKNILL